jgi:TolB-like protein
MATRNSWLVGALVAVFAPALTAQQAAPIVTVAGFQVDSATKVSTKAVDAMADELALQLVESGRFRVMDRTWLGLDSGRVEGSIARIKTAAREAGVDYLIVGRIATFSEVSRHASPPPRMMPPFGPGAASPFGPRFGPGGYAPVLRPASRQDRLRISVELVDVRSGLLLAHATETCGIPQSSGAFHGPSRLSPIAARPSGPLAAVAAALIARPRRSSAPNSELQRAVTTIAQTFVRWNPPATAGK